jgi:hypothetical protein
MPDIFHTATGNIRRIKSRLNCWITNRFNTLGSRGPTLQESNLVFKALASLAPSPCSPITFQPSHLNTYFGMNPSKDDAAERTRIFLLTTCLPNLIEAFNNTPGNTMRLAAPNTQLRIP